MANKLEEARKVINEVDSQMSELFVKRMRAVEMVYEYKKELTSIEKMKVDNAKRKFDLGLITKLQYIIYLNIINRIKNDDIDSEIYLNDKLKPIYLIYLRRNGLDSDERKYSKAIDNVIEKYDGNSSISSCLYKSLTEVYSDNIKKKLL